MLGIGALCFGLVIGWASAFIACTPGGVAVRLLFFATAALSLAGLGSPALYAGIVGILLGLGAHEAFLLAIPRRS